MREATLTSAITICPLISRLKDCAMYEMKKKMLNSLYSYGHPQEKTAWVQTSAETWRPCFFCFSLAEISENSYSNRSTTHWAKIANLSGNSVRHDPTQEVALCPAQNDSNDGNSSRSIEDSGPQKWHCLTLADPDRLRFLWNKRRGRNCRGQHQRCFQRIGSPPWVGLGRLGLHPERLETGKGERKGKHTYRQAVPID